MYIGKIREAPRNTNIGDWFEYLVAAALVKNVGSPDQPDIRRCCNSITQYLKRYYPNQFYKPDEMCGPDLIFKNGNVVWLVQVRCVKAFYRAYRLNSIETLNPDLFYAVRNVKSELYGTPLKGYEKQREDLLRVLKDPLLDIRKMVVACTRVRIPDDSLKVFETIQ